MKLVLQLFLLATITASGLAQPDSFNESPHDVVYTHLYYLQPDTYDPDLAAKSFRSSPDSSDTRDLAIKLKQIFDGQGLFVRLNVIPDLNNYTDTSSNSATFVIFPKELPEVYVEKVGSNWYYSEQTAQVIKDLHKELYPLGSDFLLKLFPRQSGTSFFGLYLWQYVGFLIFIFLGFIFFFVFKFVIGKLLLKIKAIGRSFLKDKSKILKKIHVLLSAWLIVKLYGWFLPMLLLPIKTSELLILLLKIASSVLFVLFVLRIFDLVMAYFERVTMETESKMDDQLLPVLKRTIQIIILSFWLFHLLSILHVNVTTLIAGISIGGLAIALAAQDTLKNLLSSIMIFLDQPFQIGDWVKTDSCEGTVEEVGFRSTRIRSFANSLIYVPNSKLTDAVVDNLGLRKYRRYNTKIGITYDTPPESINAFVTGLRELVLAHPQTRKDAFEIHLNDLGPSAIEILFYIFFEVPDWNSELKARHDILMSIIRLASDLNVSFAFPSQSIYIEKK